MVTANHRVKLTLACSGGEVTPELIENRRARRGALAGVARANTGSFFRVTITGVPRDKVHYGLAHGGRFHTKFSQHLVCHTLVRAHHTQQDMFGADVTVVKLNSLAHRKLQHFLRARGKGNMPAGRVCPRANNVLHLFTYAVERNTQRLQGSGRNALPLVN